MELAWPLPSRIVFPARPFFFNYDRPPAWSANGKLNPRKTAAYRVSRACHTPMVLNPSPLCAGRVWKLKFFQGKIDVTIGNGEWRGKYCFTRWLCYDGYISIVARVYLYFNPEMADRDLFIGYKSCLTFFRIPNFAAYIYIYASMKYRWISRIFHTLLENSDTCITVRFNLKS